MKFVDLCSVVLKKVKKKISAIFVFKVKIVSLGFSFALDSKDLNVHVSEIQNSCLSG